jgi:hypothetical protein
MLMVNQLNGFGAGGGVSPPRVVQRTHSNSGAATSSPHTVSLPTGTVVGNMLVGFLYARGGTGNWTAPTGWTLELNNSQLGIIYRVVDGSEGSSVSVTGPSSRADYLVYEVENVDTLNIGVGTTATGTTANADPPSITLTSTKPSIVFAVLGIRSTTDVTGAPSGYSNLTIEHFTSDPQIAVAEKVIAAGVTNEDPGAFTSPTATFAVNTCVFQGP